LKKKLDIFFSQKPIACLSPLDGRYSSQTASLKQYFSEAALIKNKVWVEIFYLIDLISFLKITKLSSQEKKKILSWFKNLKLSDWQKVKKIEKITNHDVKAIEYFIKENLINLGLKKITPFVHWGLTSEDVNNLAYALMLQKAKNEILIFSEVQLIKAVLNLAEKYAHLAMPGRTHGQIAVPTTLGKEFVVFASRAAFFLEKIINFKIKGKLNGAVGNFNAQKMIFPKKEWLAFSQKFIKKLKLDFSLATTQRETESSLVYFLDLWRQLNNVWLDLDQDVWLYISFNYLKQKVVKQEVGSSTMPYKVNPINFENSEGNFQLANSLLVFLSNKLSHSRLQRDLSDSTVKRNLGTAFGYSLLANKSLLKGLVKIEPYKSVLKKELKAHPEVLTEALQLILKTWGKKKAYEKIKLASRGKKVSWRQLIKDFSVKQKSLLEKWQPEKYTGLASAITKKEIKKIKLMLKNYL